MYTTYIYDIPFMTLQRILIDRDASESGFMRYFITENGQIITIDISCSKDSALFHCKI